MDLPELQSFNLVGGTALALKYGHRTSVDVDLFTTQDFEQQPVIDALIQTFGKDFVYNGEFSKWGIFCFIGNLKLDLVYYPHKIVHDIEIIDGIRLYHDKDLAAMKIQAILGRGAKKDFWDVFELLQHYSVNEMIDFYIEKYPNQMLLITIPQALTYFADAENSIEPKSLNGQTWKMIKNGINKKISNFLT
jgi:predicted nucleotidyltransferase component of viral defense system